MSYHTQIGRTRERLAKLLCEAGYETKPWDLFPARGWLRSSSRMDNDAFRWEGSGVDNRGVPVHFYSWHTMKSLLAGIRISKHPDLPLWFEVTPKE